SREGQSTSVKQLLRKAESSRDAQAWNGNSSRPGVHIGRKDFDAQVRITRCGAARGRVALLVCRKSPPPDLIFFHRSKQGGDVSFAEAVVAFALDELEEHRADHQLREYLHQEARFAACGAAVDENSSLVQRVERLPVPRQPLAQHLIVSVGGRGRKLQAFLLQAVERPIQVVAGKGDMLDAFAVVGAQVLGNLSFPVAASFLVQGDADLAIGRHHYLGVEAGILPGHIELAELAKAKDARVEVLPMRYAPVVDVVSKMIDRVEARARRKALDAFLIDEVDVVDAEVLAVAIDQIDQRVSDAADRRDVELHHAGSDVHWFRTALDR